MDASDYFEKGFNPIRQLYAESLEDESDKDRRRSAALAWVMVDFTYNNFNGTLRYGLLERHNMGR